MTITVARERGNAHTSEHLAQPGADRDARLFRTARLKGLRKRIGKIRYDGAGSSGHEQRDVICVNYCRGYENKRHFPQPFATHVLPHRRRRKKRGKRRTTGIDRPIGKEEETRAPAAAQRGSGKLSKTAARPRDSSCGGKS